MLFGWRISVLLLLTAGSEAQSGDGDSDPEVRLSCTSHISTGNCSVTCQLTGGRSDDDEDVEGDSIQSLTVCQKRLNEEKTENECWETVRDTVTSRNLRPLVDVNVSAQLKSGRQISTTVNLQKIVKPRSPRIWNVTFVPETNQTVVSILIPYNNEYLNPKNQVFQLHIWTDGSNMVQNFSSKNFIQIDKEHLRPSSEYHVKVRAIPDGVHLQGTWSEWSNTVSFFTPPGEGPLNEMDKWPELGFTPVVCFICLLVVILSIVFWKNKIFSYVWPSIPHPKQTLVQICKPNKGLLLNLNPEVFSSLKVYPLEKTECGEAEPSLRPTAPDGSQSSSTQSSDCSSTTSASTEELEICALLSDSENSLPSPEDGPQPPQPEHSGAGSEEAYVTMSSFYQIK
ncbi:interleukin-7 receptor subunit alpha [Kryptolebias marmoratus]|uniref:Interleukin 7 receptor n=1 Tax=Kryptolebias marmoratus TaxID=37003 RepID=A0A3Q3BR31_KRYMA|nr:interleukin-7 receptor subunit alpha [Kryptolebias marmoratus]